MNEKDTHKFFVNIGIFTVVMALTFRFVFHSQDISRTAKAVRGMSLEYLAAAFLLAVLFVSAEGCMIWYLLKGIGGRTKLFRCIGYSFIGFFFSGLTPSATGGQPMQLYYIAFADTPGFFARLIRIFLKQRYVHVALAADKCLTECYSVGRRNPAIPVFAGFEKEDKHEILHTFPEAYYRVCRLACTREQKRKIMEKLKEDYERRYRIHYAVLALPFLVFGIPFYVRNQYTCSSYLARTLKEQGICISDKHFSLVTPKDFFEYEEMETVFEGELSELVAEDETLWGENPLKHWLKGVSVYE